MLSSISKRNIFFIAIAAALVLLYIVPLGSYPLMEPDEGRYAEIPREMIESGNYITPMLNYVKYFEKPVFLYWMNAASFHIFGQNEFAARIGTALCALAGALATGMLGAFIYGRIAGFIAGVVTATSLLYFAIGTINITDMPLSFFLTLAFASFYAAHVKEEKKYYLLFYFACAMALLTKGLIGVVLPGAVIFFYIIFTKQWKLFYKPLYLPGIVLFFAVSVPWFYLVCRDNPDFFRFFFIQEHFLRYATKMHHRYEPFWFFFPMIPLGLVPWTAFFFALFSKKSVARSPEGAEEKRAGIYLALWFAVIFLFFSFQADPLHRPLPAAARDPDRGGYREDGQGQGVARICTAHAGADERTARRRADNLSRLRGARKPRAGLADRRQGRLRPHWDAGSGLVLYLARRQKI
ncbi:phospholipid carrier-dependent glycosyltransferase [Cloacibacillus evryensis]|uniref:phospholipid carrier-dependent glycosyltransferase n=1 Tax=Cloacibacillus evryensis TaxID=508460 RepID=UPI0026E0A5D9|nr:phospholipid carrier-dependent glycosyltransferase [Cloacibacillus evryensis]